MARQVVDIGVEGNDGTGDSIRESFRKVNSNFQEIYAVVGEGGQITFTSLSDTPTPEEFETYQGNGQEAWIPIVAQDASGIEIRRLASNSVETDGAVEDTVTFNVSEDGYIILKTANAQVSQDSTPTLGGPLDAGAAAIANVETTQDAIDTWNSIHSGTLTLDDVVIDKKFADRNYYNRQLPGERVNIDAEPVDTSEYFKEFVVDEGNAESTGHGLTQASTGVGYIYNAVPIETAVPLVYDYTEISGGGTETPQTDVPLTQGQVVYVRIVDADTIEFYLNQSDVFITDVTTREKKRLKLDDTNATGTHIIQNPYYNEELQGNWVANEALPRDSVVRRQGDDMEGLLFLSDHPGNLAGAGTPTGPSDLQAVTKLYVDSQSTESSTNLFVSTQGNDDQALVPPGRQGRSLFYSFRSLAAAARKAEEIQIASPYEPGPFMQDVVYTEISGNNITVTESRTTSRGVNGATTGDLAVKSLVDANKVFVIEEVFAWLDDNIANEAVTNVGPTSAEVSWAAVTYDKKVLEEELIRVIDASTLDHLSGLTANQLSKRVGLEYFAQLDVKARAGLTQNVFESAVNRARIVIENVLFNDSNVPFNALQDTFSQTFISTMPDENGVEVPLSDDRASINNNLLLIQNIVDQGVFSAPLDVPGKRYLLEFTNGTKDFVDQGDPQNRDLRVGKLLRGKTSGAIGKIASYTAGINNPGGSDDQVLLDLLAPIEFIRGEKLEFGNTSKERNISIRVESGIYYEDFPIKLPANTSIVGDESRRCIVRPKQRASTSLWADTYFYRDIEFDNLRGDNDSATGIADTNLPIGGTEYINPISGNLDGYFGRHYLNDPTTAKNVDDNGTLAISNNPGGFEDSATLLEENVEFVVSESVAWIEERTARTTPPAGFTFTYDQDVENTFNRLIRDAVTQIITDLRAGGSNSTLEMQGDIFYNVPANLKDAADATFGYVRTIWEDVLQNIQFQRAGAVDSFIGADAPAQYINTDLTADSEVFDPVANDGLMIDLVTLLRFAFSSNFNPAKLASEVDCFLLNDASMIRGVTVQGHGGFMAVLDPAGQILTKSPFVHNALTFSKGINRQAFRGGIFADAFCANTPLTITNVLDGGFRLEVKSAPGSALSRRKPLTPAPFYINGIRYQVNDIPAYDPEAAEPTAELVLDPFSGTRDINGDYQGFQEPLNQSGEFEITLQTPGTRSVLTNDITMINDLGYGVVAANGAICDLATTSTFYCHASSYAYNGSEIRSSSGGSSYGVYGLVADGSDPNEVPDDVVLINDVNQAALSFEAEVVLFLEGNISVTAGQTITQVDATGEGTVVVPTNAKQIYLKDITGTFTLTGEILVDGGSTGVVPRRVDSNNYSNPENRLAIHFFETETVPNDRGDVSYYHDDGPSAPGTISRYQVTTIEELTGVVVDGHILDNGLYTYAAVTRGPDEDPAGGSGAVLLVSKTQKDSGTYFIEPYNNQRGNDYKVGDTFTVSGADLNGSSPANDVTITVEEVIISETNLAGDNTGPISRLSISGTPNIVAGLTPIRNGQVYRANFSTSNDEFNPEGLLAVVPYGQPIMLRANRNFIFDEIRDTDRLTIRPSTAINFSEQPEFTYRAINFASDNAIGEDLGEGQAYAGTDITFDFVNLIVSNGSKTLAGNTVYELDSSTVTSTTLGATTGDTTIAIDPISNRTDVYRLNNNDFTTSDFQPPFVNNQNVILDFTNQLPMVMTWQGKKHYVYNYREVVDTGTAYNVQDNFDSAAHTFALVDLLEVDGNVLTLSGESTFERLNSNYVNAIVRQTSTGAQGKVKQSGIETTTLKLFDITGTFNTSDTLEISTDGGSSFQAFEDDSETVVTPVEILVRETNLTAQTTGIAEPLDTTQGDVITLRAAIQDGSPAVITIQISTCRATGHDFNDIGTGSYNNTNFPNTVLGDPINDPDASRQVQERERGRVFYEATDQDGFFRVGRFLTVDQGTGIVTIAANIALSDVDGIGFRRGVVVSEFSTDTAMSDNATDAVPTESAVRGYISRRLGFDQAGNAISNPLGPSVIPANGSVPMAGNLSLGGFTVTNLAPVNLDTTEPSSAVPRSYVDSRAEAYNKFEDQRDVEIATAAADQFIGISGLKTIYIPTDTLSGGQFALDLVLTNSNGTDNYGTIRGIRTELDSNFGNTLIISFAPGPNTFNVVDPFVASPPRIYHKVSGTTTANGSGGVKNGPFFEVINLAEQTSNSDITLTIDRPRNSDQTGSYPNEPTGYYDLQIKAGVIVNADVNASAAIAQTKLNLQAADTFTGTPPASKNQSTLGLAKFDAANFTSTHGWVQIKTGGISFANIQQIPTETVIGRSTAGTGTASAISFSTVVDQGGGIRLTDFPYTDINNVESNNYSNTGALTRVGNDDFTVIPITATGVKNSLVKTSNTGRIVAQDIAIGQSNSAVILRPSGTGNTGLEILTLGGGQILFAQGTTNPKVSIPGSVDIGATGVSESTIQGLSGSAGASWVAARWARHSFIEAVDEGGTASTGVSIGAGSGKTIAGEVGIVTRNTGTNTSPIPFIFSSSGVRPDINNVYDIGTSGLRYRDIYVRNINNTGSVTNSGNLSVGGTLTVSNNTTLNSDLSVAGLATVGGLTNSGTTTLNGNINLGDALTDNIAVNGQITTNVVGKANLSGNDNNGQNLGSNPRRWNTVYAKVFDGTATSAQYADLAENYLADADYADGTVLVFGGAEEITTTSTKGDHRAAGVVSTNPAHLMNAGLEGDHVTALALQGRVPCNVIGKVQKGDIIVTAGLPGYGCVNNQPAVGTMIGKAVGEKDTDGKGTVEVVIGRT